MPKPSTRSLVIFRFDVTARRLPPGGSCVRFWMSWPEDSAVTGRTHYHVLREMGDLMLVQTVPSDNPSFVTMHPSEEYLYVLNEIGDYEEEQGSLEAYAIDDASIDDDGMLHLISYMTEDVGFPRKFNIDPTGRWLYAMGQKSDEIVQFYIDPNSGALIPTGSTTVAMVPVSMAFKS